MRIIDFSPIVGLSIRNYACVNNNDLDSIFSDIESSTSIEVLEDNITTNLLMLLLKNVNLPNLHLFELVLDVVNESCKTTLIIKNHMLLEIDNYIKEFKKLLNILTNKYNLHGQCYNDFIITDNLGLKLIITEANNDISFGKGSIRDIVWEDASWK